MFPQEVAKGAEAHGRPGRDAPRPTPRLATMDREAQGGDQLYQVQKLQEGTEGARGPGVPQRPWWLPERRREVSSKVSHLEG